MKSSAFYGVSLTRHTRFGVAAPPLQAACEATLAAATPGKCVESGAAAARPPVKMAALPMTLSDTVWFYVG